MSSFLSLKLSVVLSVLAILTIMFPCGNLCSRSFSSPRGLSQHRVSCKVYQMHQRQRLETGLSHVLALPANRPWLIPSVRPRNIRGFQLTSNDADRRLSPLSPMSLQVWGPALPSSMLPRHRLKVLRWKPAIPPSTIRNHLPPTSLSRPASVASQPGTAIIYPSLLYLPTPHPLPPR
jgi:hypothetical protein